MHIAIAGNLGCGKTSLTTLLAKHYGMTPKFETVAHNPYLEDYYADIKRWSFNLEVFFLKERFRDMVEMAATGEDVIQDRTVYEGAHVFVANNFNMGHLSRRDFETYMDIFSLIECQLSLPDLMIYLKADVSHLVKNIQKRGRDYEQTIQIEYLIGLNKLYEEFINNHYRGKVITVDVNGIDFVNNPADLWSIINQIDAALATP